jgi:hypothetical protein
MTREGIAQQRAPIRLHFASDALSEICATGGASPLPCSSHPGRNLTLGGRSVQEKAHSDVLLRALRTPPAPRHSPVGLIEHVRGFGAHIVARRTQSNFLSAVMGTVDSASDCVVAEERPSPSAPQVLAPLRYGRGFFWLPTLDW